MLSKLAFGTTQRSLHTNLMNLRSLVTYGHGLQSFSTAASGHATPAEPKVIYQQLTP